MKISRIFVISTFVLLTAISGFGQRLVVDPVFAPNLNGSVEHVKVLPDQKILIAGGFTTINGQTRNYIARLNQDGSLDTSFNANLPTGTSSQPVQIYSMDVQTDGKILIGGRLPNNGVTLPVRIFRLNPDGSFDNSLTSIPYLVIEDDIPARIRKVQQMPDGKMLVCGRFFTSNGNSQHHLARYNSDGSFDATFTTALNQDCYDVEVQPDGKYLVAGRFTTVNGSTRLALVRFNANDSIDTSFNAFSVNNPNTIDEYYGIKLLDDGTIYAFHYPPFWFNNTPFYNDFGILRLNADGSLKSSLATYARPATDLEILPNGKIIAIGDFFDAGDMSSQSETFNRFTPDGRHDGSVTVEFGYQRAKSLEIAADEKIIVGGSFTSVQTNGVSVSNRYLVRLVPQPVPIKHKYDFDGDGKDDLAVFRPSDRVWYVKQSTNGFAYRQFGLSTDKPVAADYDGDGKADIAVFRDGVWYWMKSSNNTFASALTGQAGDIPQGGFKGRFYLRGDMNTDGTPGLLTFRSSEAAFYLQNPYQQPYSVNLQGMSVTSGDIPVSADYDGDEYEDVAVFRDGNWSYLSSNDSRVWSFRFGSPGDKPVPADYDGDGRADYAVFRPSTGVWWIQQSTGGSYAVHWGLSGDLPVPADYNGDGKTDIAVYRNGVWYIFNSTGSYHIEQFGLSGDIPAQLKP